MGLVHDERVVGREHAVADRLGQEDPVGHDLDVALLRGGVLEADLVADGAAERLAELLGDAAGDRLGGDAPGLGVADQPADPAPGREAELGELGGFARAGVARDDDHRVAPDRRDDLVPAGGDGEVVRGCGRGQPLHAATAPLGRACQQVIQPFQLPQGGGVCRVGAAQARKALAGGQPLAHHGGRQQPLDRRQPVFEWVCAHRVRGNLSAATAKIKALIKMPKFSKMS